MPADCSSPIFEKIAKIPERHGDQVSMEVHQTLRRFATIYNHAAIHLLRSLGQQFDLPKPAYDHFHRQHVTATRTIIVEAGN